MIPTLSGTTAIVTGASSGIGAATARRLASHGATVALVARRGDRLKTLVAEIEQADGNALVVETDITDRAQADRAVQTVVDTYGRLDILVNNAGLMLLGPTLGADVIEWERMIAVNQSGLLYMTNAALPHLVKAAQDQQRAVADLVNISSIAGRTAWPNYAAYSMTKFGVNGFTESLRQEMTTKHVRVGVIEPGGVDTELGSHNTGDALTHVEEFFATTEALAPDDIADAVTYMVTRPRHTAIREMCVMPTEQA